jgi:hypothetical protein
MAGTEEVGRRHDRINDQSEYQRSDQSRRDVSMGPNSWQVGYDANPDRE